MERCYNCMSPLNGEAVCPHCGFEPAAYHVEAHQLKPGCTLNGRYYIGRVLNEGGFGITYSAYDNLLNYKVAIKEFYMFGCVNRNDSVSHNIVPTQDETENVDEQKKKFIREAQVLAKFNKEDGIVHVHDYCEANNTAYIIMEFEPGPNLKEYIASNGVLDSDKAISLFLPVLEPLGRIHKENLIHRDITPDNMMFSSTGNLVLIDFGSAREVSLNGTRSLSVVLKPGFAPIEQYNSRGSQGPFTDVYSICATIYYAISGQIPINSLERAYAMEDPLVPLKTLLPDCPANFSDIIARGMAIFAKDRYQTVEELMKDLKMVYGNPTASVQSINPSPKSRKIKRLLPIVAGSVLLLTIAAFTITNSMFKNKSADRKVQDAQATVQTPVTDIVQDTAEEPVSESEFVINPDALAEDEHESLAFYQHSFTGYLDELTNWTGHERFVNQDYDLDGTVDRVKITMDAELLNVYHLDVIFGDSHEISIHHNFAKEIDPYITSAHLFGDHRQLIVQSVYETSTNPEYTSYFHIYSCLDGERIYVGFDNEEPDDNQHLTFHYERGLEDSILASSSRLNFSTVLSPSEEDADFWYDYLRFYPDTDFNQSLYMAGTKTIGDRDVLIMQSMLLDQHCNAQLQFEVMFSDNKSYRLANPIQINL